MFAGVSSASSYTASYAFWTLLCFLAYFCGRGTRARVRVRKALCAPGNSSTNVTPCSHTPGCAGTWGPSAVHRASARWQGVSTGVRTRTLQGLGLKLRWTDQAAQTHTHPLCAAVPLLLHLLDACTRCPEASQQQT